MNTGEKEGAIDGCEDEDGENEGAIYGCEDLDDENESADGGSVELPLSTYLFSFTFVFLE